MKLLRTFMGFTVGLSLFSLFSAPALAQSALDNIKAKLEGEGISVVDYSSPEGQWGSLTKDWIAFLSEEYSSLKDLAGEFKDDFEGPGSITDLRRRLAIAVAEKSRLTVQSDIAEKNSEIQSLQEDLKNAEEDAKMKIADIISGATLLNQNTGVNLIFHEIDFYYNYSKWGRLPVRIVAILEENGYENLKDLVEVVGTDDLESTLSSMQGLSADDISLILNSVNLLSGSGEGQVHAIALGIVNVIKNLAIGLAVIWIVVAGIRMIFAQGDESIIKEQKNAILYVIIGLVVILLVGRVIDFLYGAPGVVRTELTPDEGFSLEVYGVINFIKAVIGMIAITFIILSGVKILFATGAEDEIKKEKNSILWIGVGLILLAINKVLVENFFIIPTQQSDQLRTSNVTSIINTIGDVFKFGLGFVGLIAFGALVYGAATMIMNYGNDDQVQKSKKIMTHAIIGILVILSAYTIVATLVVFD